MGRERLQVYSLNPVGSFVIPSQYWTVSSLFALFWNPVSWWYSLGIYVFKVSGSKSWLFGGFVFLNKQHGYWDWMFPDKMPVPFSGPAHLSVCAEDQVSRNCFKEMPGPALRHSLVLHTCWRDGAFSSGSHHCEAPGSHRRMSKWCFLVDDR